MSVIGGMYLKKSHVNNKNNRSFLFLLLSFFVVFYNFQNCGCWLLAIYKNTGKSESDLIFVEVYHIVCIVVIVWSSSKEEGCKIL